MKRLLIAAVVLVAGIAPAIVLAATSKTKPRKTGTSTGPIGGTVVLGATKTPIASPVCPPGVSPGDCKIVLTRVTALETIRDNVTYPTTVRSAGTIVAFTLGLAQLSSNASQDRTYIHDADTTYGGVTMAAITVLKPGPGKNKNRRWTVVAESPLYHLEPYLGHVVQFPLATPIAVTPGETIALTTPTWAPVLSYDLPLPKFAYRQSRTANCTAAGHYQNAQQTVGQAHDYKCDYPGTRVEYNATEVLSAPVPKSYVHAPRQP